jgi:hypothetical protein
MPVVTAVIFTPIKFSVGPGVVETEVLVPPSASSITVRPIAHNAKLSLTAGVGGKMGTDFLEISVGSLTVIPVGTPSVFLASTAGPTDVEVMFTAARR